MRNINFLQTRFLRAATLAGSAFFLAAPNHVNIDPSLLAAEPYNPALWNGNVSNEYLRRLTNDHAEDLSKIATIMWPDHPEYYSRNSYNDINLPFLVAEAFSEMKEKSTIDDLQFLQGLSQRFNIPHLRMTMLYHSLMNLNSQLRFQDNANCYAYSTNDYRNNFYGVNVGLRNQNPHDEPIITTEVRQKENYQDYIQRVIIGATQDGLIFTGKEWPTRAGYYRGALYTKIAYSFSSEIKIPNDFHWARQNRDGTWSHKMANLNVSNVDFSGRVITDITRADFKGYQFIGYFLVPRGGIDVGSPNSNATIAYPQMQPARTSFQNTSKLQY